MQPQGRSSRRPATSGGGTSRGRPSASDRASGKDKAPSSSKSTPPAHRGPGLGTFLLALLLLAGLGTLLVRLHGARLQHLLGATPDAPPCPAVVNRWANQRVAAARAQLEQDHGLYRAEGDQLNAVTATMNWIDDRIIDQRMGEEQEKVRASVLRSAHCFASFEN